MNANKRLCIKLIHCGNMNIVNPQDNLNKSNFFIPMGLFALANQLKRNCFDAEIIHFDLELGHDIEEILDFAALDAVGMDCHWVNQSLVVLEMARIIKRIKPGIFTFLGGYTASFFAEEILTGNGEIDAIIRGDGEIPLLELCEVLNRYLQENHTLENCTRNSLELQQVSNLVWRKTTGVIISNDWSYVATAKDLDQLDFAGMSVLRNWENYRDLCKFWTRFSPINQFPLFFLEVGRGCIYDCSFCGGNSAAQRCINNRNRQVVRSIDAVISTIKKAISFGCTMFFTSFEFENSEEWYNELFHRIKQEKLKINFSYGSWGLPSLSLVDTLSECVQQVIIEISPETSDPELRKKNKDLRLYYDNRQLEKLLEHVGSKNNVKVQLYFGYFLPFDTIDTIFETMTYITELFFKYSRVTEIIYSNLSTDPGSSLYFKPEKYHIDISVRHFNDYLQKLEEIYTVTREIPYGGMTLYHPTYIPKTEAVNLMNKIHLFNKLLSECRKAILEFLNKTGKFDFISAYLREIDLSTITASRVILEDIKELWTFPENEEGIPGNEVPGSSNKEDGKILTEAKKNAVCLAIRKAKKDIRIEFDI